MELFRGREAVISVAVLLPFVFVFVSSVAIAAEVGRVGG